jgi:hypothetical protein
MKLHTYSESVPSDVAAALNAFEEEFTYPLGPDARFRISHGETYLRFFQAMGPATLVIAEDRLGILGGITRVSRRLVFRGRQGSGEMPAHYLCDLKVAARARGTRVLACLLHEAMRQIKLSGNHACYGIVMSGTGRSPGIYTGRIGVPQFVDIGEVVVLRIAPGPSSGDADRGRLVEPAEWSRVFSALPVEGVAAAGGGGSSARSQMAPLPMVSRSGDACGILEDTRLGKRLFVVGGAEMRSAHVSRLRFASPNAAADLLDFAARTALRLGFEAVFAALPRRVADTLQGRLGDLAVLQAPASIFGHALPEGLEWWPDTAEI